MSISKTYTGDMRREDRLPVSHEIRAIDRTTGIELGRVVNISSDGIMLLGVHPVMEHSILELALEFRDSAAGTIAVGVESLWCHSNDDRSMFWSGHFIIDISAQDLERLLGMAG